jgi:hypothetical protein
VKDKLKHKLKQLTPKDQLRAALILTATPQIIAAMMSCKGPDDALIALTAAMQTVFAHAEINVREDRAAELTFEFVVEALLIRSKKK